MAVWKKIESYADIDGIETRMKNRSARDRFIKLFGITEYAVSLDVRDWKKLFAGNPDFENPGNDDFWFQQTPDRSFDRFGAHVRFFRVGDGTVIMTAVLPVSRNTADMEAWAASRECIMIPAIIDGEIHGDHMTRAMYIFMSPETAEKYSKEISEIK